MKVFISWSGNRSRAVAELLSVWMKCVLQATRPWVSSRDIDRGALWFTEIGDQLKDTSVGIICLTQENKNRPWILFEAGALAKGLSSNRVCTLLVDLKSSDLENPLAQFNHTLPEKDSIRSIVNTLNNHLQEAALEPQMLDQVFDTYWPQFESRFKDILKKCPAADAPPARSEQNVLAEILENTRSLGFRLRALEIRDDRAQLKAAESAGGSGGQVDFTRVRELARILARSGMSEDQIVETIARDPSTAHLAERGVRSMDGSSKRLRD